MQQHLSQSLEAVTHSVRFRLLALESLIRLLGDERFAAELSLLQGSTIGKHVRHIVEFYDMLLKGAEEGSVCYDDRQHDSTTEQLVIVALDRLRNIREQIGALSEDRVLELRANFTPDPARQQTMQSTLLRELAYNLDHSIHHFAVIKLATLHYFPEVEIPHQFDLAYSTIHYQQS